MAHNVRLEMNFENDMAEHEYHFIREIESQKDQVTYWGQRNCEWVGIKPSTVFILPAISLKLLAFTSISCSHTLLAMTLYHVILIWKGSSDHFLLSHSLIH